MTPIYQDDNLIINKEYLIFPQGEREAVAVSSISEIAVSRILTKEYTDAVPLFVLLGLTGIFFAPMLFFFLFAISAYFTKRYEYALKVTANGRPLQIMRNKRKGKVKSLAHTIHGLCFSARLLTFAST